MQKKFFAILFLIFFLLNSFRIDKDKTETISVDGKNRSFIVHLPKNYNPNNQYPLILALHGGKGQAKSFNRSTNYRFNQLADEEDFIVVYPQGIDKSWNDNSERNEYGKARKNEIDDVGFISKLIDHLISTYHADSNNVFACGISNGGLMSATLALKLPNKINAIGMVASNFSAAFVKEMEISQPQPFSVIIIHGTEDPIFPYKEGEISIFRQKRGKVIGVEKSISYLCKLNGNSISGIETVIPDTDKTDECTSSKISYPNIKNPHLKVELIKVKNGGHTWPGGNQYLPKKMIGLVTNDFNAVDQLWIFFKKQIKNGK